MYRKRLCRLNESRDNEIKKLVGGWKFAERNLNEPFLQDRDPIEFNPIICYALNTYTLDEFFKDPFFSKNTWLDPIVWGKYSPRDMDGFIIGSNSSSVRCSLMNVIYVSQGLIKVAFRINLKGKVDGYQDEILNFKVKYNKEDTVSDVIEFVLDSLDSHIHKIISSMKNTFLSLDKELQKRLDGVYSEMSDAYAKYKDLYNEFEELGGNIDNWENIGKKRIDSSL